MLFMRLNWVRPLYGPSKPDNVSNRGNFLEQDNDRFSGTHPDIAELR